MSSRLERLLVLAEGFSGDPHYGKTARGVLAYGERPVVARGHRIVRGESLLGEDVDERVDRGLDGLDAVERGLDELARGHLAVADEPGEIEGRAEEEVLHRADTTPRARKGTDP